METIRSIYSLAANVWPVKPCAVMILAKQETHISIGFTGLLGTDRL